jgi:hypothetical protein
MGFGSRSWLCESCSGQVNSEGRFGFGWVLWGSEVSPATVLRDALGGDSLSKLEAQRSRYVGFEDTSGP